MEEAIYHITPTSPEAVQLLHITDCHLFHDPNGRLLGLNTEHSLKAVLEAAQKVPHDAILATGDLAQDASAAAYQRLGRFLSRLNRPVFWTAGNHDDPAVMHRHFIGQHIQPHKCIQSTYWQILMLDSSVRKKVHGYLSDKELAWLEKCLTAHPEKWALIVLHHQPVPVGSQWLDGIGLKNSATLFALIARFPQVKGILWGHVHQEFQQKLYGLLLMATPSTCVQFAVGSSDFKAGTEEPGYRTLKLFHDGSIETEVHRTRPMEFTVDYSIKGY